LNVTGKTYRFDKICSDDKEMMMTTKNNKDKEKAKKDRKTKKLKKI